MPSSWACAPSKTRTIHSSTPRYRAKANAEARPLSELAETYKKQLVVFGLGVAVMGAYIAMLIRSMTRVDACADQTPLGQHGQHCDVPSGRPLDLRSGKITAAAFDREQDWNEWIMGITGLRKLMGGLARGHVLEVAVGTGRNIEYMDWDEIKNTAPRPADEGVGFAPNPKSPEDLHRDRVKRRMEKGKKGLLLPGDDAPEVLSFTGVDVSADVLEVTWTKLKKAVPELIPRRRRKVNEGQQAQQETQETQQQQKSVEEKKPVTFRNPLKALSESKMPAPARHPAPPAASQTKDQALAANIGSGRIRLFKSDAQSQLPSPPPMLAPDAASTLPAPRYFDTILQNFAICSVADPHQLLANMARVLRPGSGRIYLLEHGRGRYDWINGLLDKFAPSHFDRYGCWWNRDIEEAVRRAEREVPGLEVVRIERPLWTQGGTMYWVELRVNPQKEHGSGNGSDSGNRTPADSSGRPTSRPAA
jgi:methyltransferase OMS1